MAGETKKGVRSTSLNPLDFTCETTLSGRSYAKMIPRWQALGFNVKLIFLRLEDSRVAIERIRVRVKQGGHDVSEGVILRRFLTGWSNFNKIYKRIESLITNARPAGSKKPCRKKINLVSIF